MADLFKYYGVSPPSYTGDPNASLTSALYNSGLLRMPIPRGGGSGDMMFNPYKNEPITRPTPPPPGAPPSAPPSPSPMPPGMGPDLNSPWLFQQGAMGSMPTWMFSPGMGIVPTPGIGQVPPGMPGGMGGITPQDQFILGLMLNLMQGSPGMVTTQGQPPQK